MWPALLFGPRSSGSPRNRTQSLPRRRTPLRRTAARLLIEALEDRTVPNAYLVTTLGDTDTGSGNKGDLRYCIAQANANPGPDVIHFAPGVRGTITLDSTKGELDVTDNLKILGPGADQLAVSGGNEVRVFYISPYTTATIARLEITLGHAEAHETVLRSHGGGILNDTGADLTLTDVRLSNNTAQGFKDVGTGPGDEERHLGGAGGGGVANRGTLTVTGCTFIDNHAQGFDGQVGAFAAPPDLSTVNFPGIGIGGGLWNWKTGTATVTDSQFIDNLAQAGSSCKGTFAGLGQGGAIYNDNDLTVTGSLFSGNRAVGGSHTVSNIFGGTAVGGAISSGTNERLLGAPESAVLKISQCVFSDNQAHGGDESSAGPQGVIGAGAAAGGGIFAFQGEATISRSLLDHNQAIGGEGGAGRVGGVAVGGGIVFVNFLPGLTGAGVTGALEGCALVGNEAIGGTGGAGNGMGVAGGRGGNGQGGGLAAGAFGTSALPGTVMVSNTLVTGNVAQGGDGSAGGAGGDGQGGGVFNDTRSTMDVTASLIIFNSAVGGEGQDGSSNGPGAGGGVYNLGAFSYDPATIIALNRASTSNKDIYP